MAPHPLQASMTQISAGLRHAVETTAAFRHNLTAGEAREHTIIDALSPFIPERFGIVSGTATNLAGEVSQQQDAMIFDRVSGAPFVKVRDSAVLPIELISASLQVKTRLYGSGVNDAVQNLVSCKRLLGSAPRPVLSFTSAGMSGETTTTKPFTAIVAYEGPVNEMDVVTQFAMANRDVEPADRVDAVAILGRGLAVWSREALGGEPELAVEPVGATHMSWMPVGDDALLMTYLFLIDGLARHVLPPYSPGHYVSASGALKDHGSWTGALSDLGYPPTESRAARRRRARGGRP